MVLAQGRVRVLGLLPPWLADTAQPDRVGAALARVIPEVAAGDVVLHDCRPKRFRLTQDGWTVAYVVTTGFADGERRDVELEGRLDRVGTMTDDSASALVAFGSETWRCALPELGLELHTALPDASLPVLPVLLDPAQARALLEDAIRSGAPAYAGLNIAACRPRVMRYGKGSRCTVLYELDFPAEAAGRHWPGVVVAKTYRGDRGQNAYDGMSALWRSELAHSRAVTIAEPLAYLPELRVLVQGPVAEDQTLKQVIRACMEQHSPAVRAELDGYLAKTAAALAALHGCGVRHGRTVTLEDEMDEASELIDRLAGQVPEAAEAAESVLRQLMQLAEVSVADPPLASHGTFRPAQVLLHQGQVGFIDFDDFCQAEPALDVALFRAAVKDCGMTAGVTNGRDTAVGAAIVLEDMCDSFLRHYQALARVSPQRVALWEALHLLTYVLHAWTKVSPARLAARMTSLERHLQVAAL